MVLQKPDSENKMTKFEYITNVVEREWEWPLRFVPLLVTEQMPKEFTEAYFEWEKRNHWRINYHVHKDNLEEAKRLSDELFDLEKNSNPEKELQIIKQLMKIKAKDYDEKTDVEKWAHMAVQLPGDIGGPHKEKIKKLITERSEGRILEIMCGFNSYFNNSPNISEVIVLDYCREMLERYIFPERTRILYDLEKVVNGKKMDFFKDETFQTIGCWGSNYLSNPVPVFREFLRILSKNGKLLIVENTSEGYEGLIKRRFKPEICSNFMKQAGLFPKITHLPLKEENEPGEYYLVEGTK